MFKTNILRIFLLIFPYFLFFNGYHAAYAQRKHQDKLATVMGMITEEYKENYVYVVYTNVSLIQGKDTLTKVITDGKFVFEDIKPGKIKISVSNVAFESQENTYEVIGGNNMI